MATNPMRLLANDVFDLDIPDHLRGYEQVDGRLVEVSHVTLRHARIIDQTVGLHPAAVPI